MGGGGSGGTLELAAAVQALLLEEEGGGNVQTATVKWRSAVRRGLGGTYNSLLPPLHLQGFWETVPHHARLFPYSLRHAHALTRSYGMSL